MTRAEFIQRRLSNDGIGREGIEGAIEQAIKFADALERSNAAPWRGSLSEVSKLTAAARDDERSECAKIADRNDQSAWGIAREIRARGNGAPLPYFTHEQLNNQRSYLEGQLAEREECALIADAIAKKCHAGSLGVFAGCNIRDAIRGRTK